MMKIVYLFPHYAQKAGTERILIDKMNWLSNHNYEVIALSYEQGDHPFAFPLSDKVKHVDLDVRFFPLYKYSSFKRLVLTLVLRHRLLSRLRTFLQQQRPDLVICTTYNPFEIDMLSELCPSLKIPFWIESHCTYLESYSADMLSLVLKRKRQLSSHQLARVSKVIALTEGDAIEWRKVVGQVKVIPNMVSLSQNSKSMRDIQHAIFVGRFADQKGLPDLLKIWSKVHQKYPEWQLDMYGTGPLKGWFLQEISNKDLGIVVHEPDANIMDRYLESAFLLLTSVYEPFGLVLVEAMSCGLPVVAFNCLYGPADIISDGVDGFLINNRDIDAFAERVYQLIRDKEMRQKMGKEAVKSAHRYSAENVMPIWNKLFESVD